MVGFRYIAQPVPMHFLLPILRILRRVLLVLVGFIALYLLAAVVLSVVVVNGRYQEPVDGIPVHVLSNGVHTDIVLPVVTPARNWQDRLSLAHLQQPDAPYRYVAFGWGDKGFYLHTPEWSDLTVNTAFTAMCYLGNTAMHVTYHTEMQENERCRRVLVSPAVHQRLVEYIEQSFRMDGAREFQHIPGYSYGASDSFYEATGVYGLFFTCNSWANAGLKRSDLPACAWTPVDEGILFHYR